MLAEETVEILATSRKENRQLDGIVKDETLTGQLDEPFLVRRHESVNKRFPILMTRRRSVEESIIEKSIADLSSPRFDRSWILDHLDEQLEDA